MGNCTLASKLHRWRFDQRLALKEEFVVKVFLYIALAAVFLALGGCAPSNYEDCAAQASKDAHGDDGLRILVNKCALDFPARRQQDGKYVYYDQQSHTNFEVKGPKPTPEEWAWIANERHKKEEQEAALRRAESQALAASLEKGKKALQLLKIVDSVATCQSSYYCGKKHIAATIQNRSELTITQLSVGWVLAATKIECATSMKMTAESNVTIQPGQTTLLEWETRDGPDSIKSFCFQVVGAQAQ